jgi:hypothetical protein
MCNELLSKYDLQENSWLLKPYDLREKWTTVYCNSFTADMTTTQRSEGMNNVFKKRFRRKLGLSELLVECDKVSASLRENELDEDFKTLTKILLVSQICFFSSLLLNHILGGYIKSFRQNFKNNMSIPVTVRDQGVNIDIHGYTYAF